MDARPEIKPDQRGDSRSAATRFSLTAILGTPVTDAEGQLRGKLQDIAVATGPDAGKVAGLVLKTRTGRSLVPSQEVFETPAGTLELRSPGSLAPLKEEGSYLLLQQDLVDRQIIDIHGRKVVRVNDVDLEWTGQGPAHLLRVAEQLEIGHYMRLGRGEEKSGGRHKASLLVDTLEAILAALYLDGGWIVARDFIVRTILEPELAHMKLETSAIPVMDFKSALQETLQARGGAQPVYALVKEEGPEHKKIFTVEVRLPEPGQFVGRAQGATKKRAEQEAARQALEHLAALPGATDTSPAKDGACSDSI